MQVGSRLWRRAMVVALAGIGPVIALTTSSVRAAEGYSKTIRCINVSADDVAPLGEAAQKAGLSIEDAKASDPIGSPAVLLWECRGNSEPKDEQIAAIEAYVRAGGRLIITLDESPGTGAFRMKAFSPTTAWKTLLQANSRGKDFPAVDAGEWDKAMFPDSPAIHLPFSFPVQPFDTAERGMQKYDRYDRLELFGKATPVHAGDAFTRPLMNRDWQTRIRGNDVGASGLLVTGKYGAGEVAVFASSAKVPTAAFWEPLLTWLDTDHPAEPVSSSAKSAVEITSHHVDRDHRTLVVELTNTTGAPASAELVARVMTWERAIVGDVDQTVKLDANGKTQIALPLPAPGPTEFQAIDAKDAFIVRLGVLSDNGTQLSSESQESIDLTPSVNVSLALDNLRNREYPFKDVPGNNAQGSSMGRRLGVPVTAYAYPPDATVTVTATLRNGVTDIAPMAKIVDENDADNPSVVALNDQVQGVYPNPIDGIQAYGVWTGKPKVDNSLLFTFPNPVHVSELVITGTPPDSHDAQRNPGEVIVEADDKPLADVKDFEAQLAAQACAVHVHFDPTIAKTIRVRIPWTETDLHGQGRMAPSIGEIEVNGYAGETPPDSTGKMTLTLTDAASQEKKVIAEQDVTLKGGEEKLVETKIPADAISTDASTVRFFRLQAELKTGDQATASTSTTQFMSIQPTNPLKPISDIHPPDGPSMNFVVTRGFRNPFWIGTGGRDGKGAWETPDDLVWTFERQLQQTGPGERHSAKEFFVSEQPFSHYCAPWSVFPDGQVVFDVAAPLLVEHAQKAKNFGDSDIMQLGFGDRWDTGPAASLLYSWPEIVAFDEFLKSQKLPGLTGKTRGELAREIQAKYDSRFNAWHMERYASSVKGMSDAFAAVGKKLILSGQGTPLVPERYQQTIADTVQGMSDDTTWGMGNENVPETTGRQMATLAFNPVWKMQEVLVWGYDSAILNNPHWHAAVGSTESSRRHYADPGWRGLIDPQGHYRLGVTYGFGMNASVAWCSTLNDFQEAFRMQERLALITPDAPIGAGLIIGNASWNDPEHATFSGGGMGGSPADSVINGVAHAFGVLSDLGVAVPFSTNVSALANWNANTPLIVLNLPDLSTDEVKILQSLHERGVHIVAFSGGNALSEATATIFGVKTDGSAADAKAVGKVAAKDVLATATTLLIPASYETATTNDLQSVAQAIRDTLSTGLQLPPNVDGYGFVRGKQQFVVIEDWREQARELTVRLRATPGTSTATAINVNDHVPVAVKRDGDDWAVTFTTRPGDGTLLCIEQK